MRPGRVGVGVLTVVNALAMGSSFLVFVVVARRSSEETLGMFAVALAIAAAANQLIDSGFGQYAVREAARTGDPDPVMAWLIRQRARVLLVISAPLVFALIRYVGFSPFEAVLVLVLVLANAWYGLSILNQQARQDFRSVAKIQLANAALFTVAAVMAYSALEELSLSMAIGTPIAGVIPVAVWDATRNRRLLFRSSSGIEHAADRKHFTGLLFANVLTSNLDTVVLGAARPSLAAAYSAAQRPALGVSTISLAVASVALPKFASQSTREIRAHVNKATRFIPMAFVAGGCAYAAGLVALPLLYGYDLANPAAFGVLVCAYALGIVFSVYSSSLITAGRTRQLTRVSIMQTLIVAMFVVLAVREASTLVMAIGILLSRVIALMLSGMMIWLATESEKGTASGS